MNRNVLLVAVFSVSFLHSADDHLVAAQRVGGHFVGPPARPPVFLNERSVQYQHRMNADLLYPRGEFVPRGLLKRCPEYPTQGYLNYY